MLYSLLYTVLLSWLAYLYAVFAIRINIQRTKKAQYQAYMADPRCISYSLGVIWSDWQNKPYSCLEEKGVNKSARKLDRSAIWWQHGFQIPSAFCNWRRVFVFSLWESGAQCYLTLTNMQVCSLHTIYKGLLTVTLSQDLACLSLQL